MSKNLSYILILSILIFLLFPGLLPAQNINVQIELQPQVDAVVEQPLDFGLIIANSGLTRIGPGDPNMGIFSIRALQAQRLLFNLQAPEFIENSDPDLDGRIPIHLETSYTDFGVNDFFQARPMDTLFEEIIMHRNEALPASEWSTAYIYVYGSIQVGDVPDGTYTGEVILTVEYE